MQFDQIETATTSCLTLPSRLVTFATEKYALKQTEVHQQQTPHTIEEQQVSFSQPETQTMDTEAEQVNIEDSGTEAPIKKRKLADFSGVDESGVSGEGF